VLLMTGVQRFLLRERGGGRGPLRRLAAGAARGAVPAAAKPGRGGKPEHGEGKEAPRAHD
jgi:multiple sugar transport system permease protein